MRLLSVIELHRRSVPIGHSGRYTSLEKLPDSLHEKFKLRGTLSDLIEALKLHRAVLMLASPGYPDQFDSVHHLPTALLVNSSCEGVCLTSMWRLASIKLDRRPHPLVTPFDSYLSQTLVKNSSSEGISSDLDEAISIHRVALALTSSDHHVLIDYHCL